MTLATRSSGIGLAATVLLFFVLNQFAVQVRAHNPELSIPLAAALVLCLIVMAGSLAFSLSDTSSKGAATIFLSGYAACTGLVAVAMLGLPEDARTIGGELFAQPFVAVPAKLGAIRNALAVAHWWTHVVLGLALLIAIATTLALFFSTDSASALTASVAGPLYGLMVVLLIAVAAAVLMALAMGMVVLAMAYIKLMAAEQ